MAKSPAFRQAPRLDEPDLGGGLGGPVEGQASRGGAAPARRRPHLVRVLAPTRACGIPPAAARDSQVRALRVRRAARRLLHAGGCLNQPGRLGRRPEDPDLHDDEPEPRGWAAFGGRHGAAAPALRQHLCRRGDELPVGDLRKLFYGEGPRLPFHGAVRGDEGPGSQGQGGYGGDHVPPRWGNEHARGATKRGVLLRGTPTPKVPETITGHEIPSR